MPSDPDHDVRPQRLAEPAIAFLQRRTLATLTTLRADGTPHVVPVGFTYEVRSGLARVITSRTSVKVANLRRQPQAALCQVDGREWITLEGVAAICEGDEAIAEAVRLYGLRYRAPRPNPERVVVELRVLRIMTAPSLRIGLGAQTV